jgi:hypothetical protein
MAVTMRATRALGKILVAVDLVLKFEVYHFLVSKGQFFGDLSSGNASSEPKISQNILPSMAVTMRANGDRGKILAAVDSVLKLEVPLSGKARQRFTLNMATFGPLKIGFSAICRAEMHPAS